MDATDAATDANVLDLWSEEDVVNAIKDAINDGAVFPFTEGTAAEALKRITDTGVISDDDYKYLSLILPYLGIRWSYLWSPVEARRAEYFREISPGFYVNTESFYG